ncbi:hypothetical protein BDV30DRAFT_204784 [Aspergillus minisclerotigenes]|uniref:Uncharacterized protein n=1 Tax=Aspergillus minisclerotigenes TaxID=656917 RepID=A0A5N6JI79_9EURO|nr:hypothetical protein BDV30DRAFT_204784 [Aspergillus minisclerotigenes]
MVLPFRVPITRRASLSSRYRLRPVERDFVNSLMVVYGARDVFMGAALFQLFSPVIQRLSAGS